MNHLNLSKRSKIILFLLIISSFVSAQSKRFYYEVNFKRDSAGSYPAKDVLVLEINKDYNIFLSNDYIVTDSLNNINKDNQFFAEPKFEQVVLYKKDNHKFDFIQNLSMYYYKYPAKREIKWNISNEHKKIGIWAATKATTDFGGRKWTAWFSQDIPLPYGPYVFYGLPGLILEVNDSENNYRFNLIQNKNYKVELNSNNFIEKLFGDRKIDITEKDWQKIQLNYYNNPIPEYKEGKAVMFTDKGDEYTQNDYRNLEKAIQNQIRIYNNPIELDKAVKYQKK
ncbi:GLPGLI family protein [Chryseobacterium sp. YIM B08800]|uniref:GLPGLI family protein n=1 Tax=Chryseobacterium sp. YIM B08800 TaxID=2984136 RepID=UPI00223EC509|nr:GLPGLI family protein [Chryseobacterium sp. YIM B08800]